LMALERASKVRRKMKDHAILIFDDVRQRLSLARTATLRVFWRLG